MAKINDIIHDMEAMLSQSDLSSTPAGKQLAESYASICKELNTALQECRSMFRMGAYSEARKINTRNHPSLTERWKILNFPKRQQWIDLCRLYNWTTPPEFDQEIIEKLLNKDAADLEFTIEDLQNQWRKMIRDGSLLEKIVLARKIYALSPDKAAHANLVNVERPWIKKLKNDADRAMEENRPEDLLEICNELTGNQWQTKISTEELKKYQPMLNEFKRKKLEEEKKSVLELIASAYSAMLLPELEQSLAAWAELEKNPFFTVTREEALQIGDARNFFLTEQAKINEEENFESLQNQLEMLLDDQEHSDPVEVERIFHQLQMFDRPIRSVLEERMNGYLERRELEAKRNHVRKCFYWGCSAAAVTALIFAGIFFGHRELEMRRDSAKIREMLDQNHIQAALDYCEKIAKERPAAAKRTVIASLHQEAKLMLKSAIAAEAVFNRTCKELETYFTGEKILDPVIGKLFATLDEKAKFLPQEKIGAREELRRRYEEEKNKIFRKNELDFLAKVGDAVNKWKQFFNDIETFAESDAANRSGELELECDNILNAFHGKIRNDVYEEQKKNFADYSTQAKDSIDQLRKLSAATKGLYFPESLDSYSNALSNIGSVSSRLTAKFAEAAKHIRREKDLSSMTFDHARFFAAATETNIVNPFMRDIKAAGNPPFYLCAQQSSFKTKVADLKQKVLEKSYKVYEFALRDAANGRMYHFYLENPASDLQVETSWDKDRVKALNVSFMLNDNGARGSAVFRVSVKKSKKGGDPEITLSRPDNQKFNALPAKFKLVGKDSLTGSSAVQTAAHYTLMKSIADRLAACNKYSQVVELIVTAVEDKSVTNCFAKAHMLRELLKLLPEGDTFYRKELAALQKAVDNCLDTPLKERWFNPTATFNAQDTGAFQKELDAIDIRKAAGTVCLNEALIEFAAAHRPQIYGVIFGEGKTWRLHNFPGAALDQSELFIHHQYGKESTKLFCTAFGPEIFRFTGGKKISENISRYFYDGQLVFTVYGQNSFAKQLDIIIAGILAGKLRLPDSADSVVWPESWPLNLRTLKQGK
ncbi:MAG: hypothetical protein E7051_08705 [Lentisphaerae bacterium]|nr:hypothetical protein [Lentisphaerota bacterium]